MAPSLLPYCLPGHGVHGSPGVVVGNAVEASIDKEGEDTTARVHDPALGGDYIPLPVLLLVNFLA